jgi:hypothetical protein
MAAKVMIVTGAPAEHIDAILDAIASAGGGTAGDYTHCAFTNAGYGRFKPGTESTPYSGEKGVVNQVAEVRIETFCPRSTARAVVNAIRPAHPYDERVIYIVPLLDESEL